MRPGTRFMKRLKGALGESNFILVYAIVGQLKVASVKKKKALPTDVHSRNKMQHGRQSAVPGG